MAGLMVATPFLVFRPFFGIEEMDDNINKIDQDPGSLGQAANRKGFMARQGGGVVHFRGEAGHLATRGAGSDKEKVGNRRETSQIKNDNVRAVAVESQTG